jgi:radical SAM superfamily enzyme YgiQ (UPF0313 family)
VPAKSNTDFHKKTLPKRLDVEINLFFPPLANSISIPPSSLAALKAYLHSHQVKSVNIRDLNIEFIHYLLSTWDIIGEIIATKFKKLLRNNKNSKDRQNYIAKLLFIYIPLIRRMKDIFPNKYSEYSDKKFRLLFDVINFYYTEGLLTEGNFLFCDFVQLEDTLNKSINDPIINQFLDKLCFYDLRFVGFSFLSESQLPFGILFSKILRARHQKINIVAGGPYVTEIIRSSQESSYLLSLFDYLVVHEGESALYSIYQRLMNGGQIEHPNVISHSHSITTEAHIEPIDCLPTLDFQGLRLDLYFAPDFSLPIFSSKGCSWGRCEFCSLVSNFYRERGIDLFIADLKKIEDITGIDHFQFVDENITPKRLRLISETIISHGLSIRWFIQVRFDKELDFDLLSLMKRAGCYAIEFGLESGSPQLLRKIRKGIHLLQVERILQACGNLNYQVLINCMVGFPDETIQDASRTISFLNKINKKFPNLKMSCNTQIVKIYKTCNYAKRRDLEFRVNQASTILEWKGPEWVSKFVKSYKGHFIFRGQFSASFFQKKEKIDLATSDPFIGLSPFASYVDCVPYDFLSRTETSERSSYLVLSHPGYDIPKVYLLNQTMEFLIKALIGNKLSLSLLRKKFFDRYHGIDEKDIASAFSKGIMHLNELEALIIC